MSPAGTLAARAVSVVARQSRTATSHAAERLALAARDSDPGDARRAIAELLDHGVPLETVLDEHIPAAARLLGEDWVEDRLGFAEVTIGCARLQSVLRDLTEDTRHHGAFDPNALHLALIVRSDEDHTLGGLIAAHQLRRAGAAVCLILGKSDDEVIAFLAHRSFDAIFLSASSSAKLGILKQLIHNIKCNLTNGQPVIIGGSVLERKDDVEQQTGADLATTDITVAMRACSDAGAMRGRSGGARAD